MKGDSFGFQGNMGDRGCRAEGRDFDGFRKLKGKSVSGITIGEGGK